MNNKDNTVKDKSFNFAVRIVNLSRYLAEEKKEYILSKQILRSGTSIGANVAEAGGGISRAEFSHRISIAYKEAKETQYWLKLLYETKFIDTNSYDSINADCDELCRLLFSILKTTKRIRK